MEAWIISNFDREEVLDLILLFKNLYKDYGSVKYGQLAGDLLLKLFSAEESRE